MTNIITRDDRIKGCIFGQAIGDALGLGAEFMNEREVKCYYPHGLKEYSQIIQDAHRSRWQKGEWTDDTEMMLCIADAIVEDKGIVNYRHIASKFKSWCDGHPLGIGRHTFKVLSLSDYLEDPIVAAALVWHSGRCRSASNGAVMRTSILGILGNTIKDAEMVCRLTHADPRCIGSCVIVSSIIHSLVFSYGAIPNFEDICNLGDQYSPEIRRYLSFENLPSDLNKLSRLNLAEKDQMGFTLKSLAAAVWTLYHAKSFEDGLLSIVNEGGDADTNAAISCSILGAKFGFSSIPKIYTENLIGKSRLESLYNDVIQIV